MSILEKKEDLFNPIKVYWEYVGCKNISLYEETNKVLNDNKLINKYNKFIDNACYHSINYFDNINLLTCINLSKKDSYKYYLKELKETHILYGIKTINVSFDILPKILYQLQYQHTKNYYDLMKEINDDYEFYEKYNKDEIEINILMLVIKKNVNIILEKASKYIVLYSNTKYKKKVMSSIFYNENSLKFLEMQDIQKLLSKDFKNNLDEFHKIKHEFLKYDYFTQENIMVNSSIILMLLGMRKNNDIDLYVDKVKNPDLLINNFSEIKNLDFVIKDTNTWPKYWDKWLDEWANKCGAKYFEEIIGFHDYHFYFCGIKLIGIDVDIQRRIVRSRPASCCDLIMYNKKYYMNLTIPKIPDVYYEYKKVECLSEAEKNKLIEDGAEYDTDNREYKIEKKTNHIVFMNKVKDYLKDRYDYIIDNEKIKEIFKIKNKVKIKIKKNLT